MSNARHKQFTNESTQLLRSSWHIRLLLAETGLEYEDVVVTGQEFARWKNSLPLPYLPIWEEEGLTLVQPLCILKHIARESRNVLKEARGMYGSTLQEAAHCDMLSEYCEKIVADFWNADFMQRNLHGLELEKKKDDYTENTLVPQMSDLCLMLSGNKCPHLVGARISFVDIQLFALLEAINKEIPLLLPSFPLLSAFHKTISNRPKIRTFCLSDKRY
ncbi:glutathione S-transferase P [Planoprotostelium fungivorum]|uniref:Glutathione S-transferase P n=1 Tax=Planoprotostelium fungivorum TaxID=1890364 RepID=A0A2P6N0K0_9EUKA|nr:glutathione S-transferase P [Planoprotostelium fungivorum]